MTELKDHNLDIVFELYKNMLKDNLGYIFRGDFTPTLTDSILSLAESNLASIGESTKIKKRVYFLMVESLQNITRHQDKTIGDSNITSGVFIIQRIDKDYYITSGNLTENTNVPPLKEKLEMVNSLDTESLNVYYKKILSEGDLSNKGGAGLGLVEMARKSGNKLAFDFKKVNDNFSYFYLQTKIPAQTGDESADKKTSSNDYKGNLEGAINFHDRISSLHLQLVYQGDFSQENVKNVLAMTEGNIGNKDELIIKKRIFNIMVELLQNIHKYADIAPVGEEGKPGIFLIGEEGNQYILTTGNLISSEHVHSVKQRLDMINSMGFEELEKLFNKTIMNESETFKGGAGLGLIDLKLKSKNNLEYGFTPLTDNHSFFSLKVKIAGSN